MNTALLFILITLGLHFSWGNKTLVAVYALTAHGDVPVTNFTDFTEVGMKRCYNLGVSLKNRYGTDFFSWEDYDEYSSHRNEFFAFHSTARRRTRESIQHFLQGAFNRTFKPVENSTQIFIPVIVTSQIKRERCVIPRGEPKYVKREAAFAANHDLLIDYQKKIGMEDWDILNHDTVTQLEALEIDHGHLKHPLPSGIDENQYQKLMVVNKAIQKGEHPYDDPTQCPAIAGDFIYKVLFDLPKKAMASVISCMPPPPPPPPPPKVKTGWELPPRLPPNSSYKATAFMSTLIAPPRYTQHSVYPSTIMEKLGCLGFNFDNVFPGFAATVLFEIYMEESDIANQCYVDLNPPPPPPDPFANWTTNSTNFTTRPAKPVPPPLKLDAPREPSPPAISFKVFYDLTPDKELHLTEWIPDRCHGVSPCPAPVFAAPFQDLAHSFRTNEYHHKYCQIADDGEYHTYE